MPQAVLLSGLLLLQIVRLLGLVLTVLTYINLVKLLSPCCVVLYGLALAGDQMTFFSRWDVYIILLLLFTAIVTPVEVAFLQTTLGALFFINRAVDLSFLIVSIQLVELRIFAKHSPAQTISETLAALDTGIVTIFDCTDTAVAVGILDAYYCTRAGQ